MGTKKSQASSKKKRPTKKPQSIKKKHKKITLKGGGATTAAAAAPPVKKKYVSDVHEFFGDVHGDLYALLETLKIGCIIEEISHLVAPSVAEPVLELEVQNYLNVRYYRLVGNNKTLVFLGDLVDGCRPKYTKLYEYTPLEIYNMGVKKNKFIRSPPTIIKTRKFINEVEFSEVKILEVIRWLEIEGRRRNLKVIKLLGNHEVQNIESASQGGPPLDDSYITPLAKASLIPIRKDGRLSFCRTFRSTSVPSLYSERLQIGACHHYPRQTFFAVGNPGYKLLCHFFSNKVRIVYKNDSLGLFCVHGGIAFSLAEKYMRFLGCNSETSTKKGKELLHSSICNNTDINIEFNNYLRSINSSSHHPLSKLFESLLWTRDYVTYIRNKQKIYGLYEYVDRVIFQDTLPAGLSPTIIVGHCIVKTEKDKISVITKPPSKEKKSHVSKSREKSSKVAGRA